MPIIGIPILESGGNLWKQTNKQTKQGKLNPPLLSLSRSQGGIHVSHAPEVKWEWFSMRQATPVDCLGNLFVRQPAPTRIKFEFWRLLKNLGVEAWEALVLSNNEWFIEHSDILDHFCLFVYIVCVYYFCFVDKFVQNNTAIFIIMATDSSQTYSIIFTNIPR